MNKPKLLNLLLLLFLWQLTAITHAQDTTSYVRPWPLESLRMPEQVRMQTTSKQGIPRSLQNYTFADTIVDTTEWEDLYDVDVVFAKSIGTNSAYYTPDIELLDDGGFLVPWYDYEDGFFHITRLDSMANEVYTNNYENISNAHVDLYKDGKYVYMAGRVNLDTMASQYSHVALIKYDLELNDTVFFKVLRSCYYGVMGTQLTYLDKDSIFYIGANQTYNYIYLVSKQGYVMDSVHNTEWIRTIASYEDEIYAVEEMGNFYTLSANGMDSVGYFDCGYIRYVLFNDHIYIVNFDNEIINYKVNTDQLYVSLSEQVEFATGETSNGFITENNCFIASVGSIEDGINTQFAYCLVKLAPNGNWLHKLYIGGTNYYDQRVYEQNNGNYLLTARATDVSEEYGSLFFASIKKWDDGVGIPASPAPKPLAVYPNPTSGKITIKLQTPQKGNIAVVNLAGQVVHTENLSKTDYPTKTVNIDHLPTGVYLLQLYSGATIKSTRIIKK